MRGYTRIFENMLLDNPAITIRLNVDYFKARAAPTHALHTPTHTYTHPTHPIHHPTHPAHPAHPTHPTHPTHLTHLHTPYTPYKPPYKPSHALTPPHPTVLFKAREAGQLPKFGMLVYTGQIDSYYAQLGMPAWG